MSIYLPDESNFYLKQAKKDYNKAVEGFKNSDRCYIADNKELIFLYTRGLISPIIQFLEINLTQLKGFFKVFSRSKIYKMNIVSQ